MPILYGAIARRDVILVEYHATTGDAPQIARKILQRVPVGEHRKSYSFEYQYYHYHADGQGLIVLVMSTDPEGEPAGARLAFNCIGDLRTSFLGSCGTIWQHAHEGGLNESFARILRDKLDYYSYNPEADPIRKARGQMDQVKGVRIIV